MKNFSMALPNSVEQASAACQQEGVKTSMLAAGTDLLSMIKENLDQPDQLVQLKGLSSLKEIKQTSRGLEIGALVTLKQLAEHADVQKSWPALVQTIEKTATPNIRNIATVGGNLCQRPRCWYFRSEDYPCRRKGGDICYAQRGDNEYHAIYDNFLCAVVHPSNLAPVFMAYEASIEISKAGQSKSMDLESFFVSPSVDITVENTLKSGEVVTNIILPKDSANAHSAYVETREKQSFDWAQCGATASLKISGGKVTQARVILNAVAPTPIRRLDLEKQIEGKDVSDETANEALFEKLARLAMSTASPLEQNSYKKQLVRATVKRALRQAVKGSA